MAARETRRTVVKQVGNSRAIEKATDVPEVKKENCKHSDSASDVELKKPTGRARTRKTTETTEELQQERNLLLHSRSARFRSASLPPVSRESLSPKANRKYRTVKVCQQQNGLKNHVNPYHTRSDTPVHILRSGKQRSSILGWVFDDGSVPLEYRRGRRRTTSVAKDKTPDDDTISLSSKVDSPAGVESDLSTCNSPVPELNKLSVSDLENDIKMPGLCSADIKSEDSFLQETRSEGDQSEISSDSNLGKTISHKISALIKRGQVSQILQQISRAREERRAQAAENCGDMKENNEKKNVKDTNSNFYSALEPSNSSGSLASRLKINPLAIEALSTGGDIKPTVSKTKESGTSRDVFAPKVFYKKETTTKKEDVKSEGILLKSSGKMILVNSVRELSRDLQKCGKIDSSKAVKTEGINSETSTVTEMATPSTSTPVKKETGTNCETSRNSVKSPTTVTPIKQESISKSEVFRKIARRSSTSLKCESDSKSETSSGKSLLSPTSIKQESSKSETFEEVLQRLEKCVYENSKLQLSDSMNSDKSSISSPTKGSMMDFSSVRNRKIKTETIVKSESTNSASSTVSSKSIKIEPKKELTPLSSVKHANDDVVKMNVSVKTEIEEGNITDNVPISSIDVKVELPDEADMSDFLDDVKSKVRRSARSSAQKATALIFGGSNKSKPKSSSPHCTDDEASNSGNMSESGSVSFSETGSKNTKVKSKTAVKTKKTSEDTADEVETGKENTNTKVICSTSISDDNSVVKTSDNSNKIVPNVKVIQKPVNGKEEPPKSKNVTVIGRVKNDQSINGCGKKRPSGNNASILHGASSSKRPSGEIRSSPRKSTLIAKEKMVRKIKLNVAKKGKRIAAVRKKLFSGKKVKTKVQPFVNKKGEKKIKTAVKKVKEKSKVQRKNQEKVKTIIKKVGEGSKVLRKVQKKDKIVIQNVVVKSEVPENKLEKEKTMIENIDVANKGKGKTEQKEKETPVIENVEDSGKDQGKSQENEKTVIANVEGSGKVQEKFVEKTKSVIEKAEEKAKSQRKKQEKDDNQVEKDGTATKETVQERNGDERTEESTITEENKSQKTESEKKKKTEIKNKEGDLNEDVDKTNEMKKSEISQKNMEEKEEKMGESERRTRSKVLNSPKKEVGDGNEKILEEEEEKKIATAKMQKNNFDDKCNKETPEESRNEDKDKEKECNQMSKEVEKTIPEHENDEVSVEAKVTTGENEENKRPKDGSKSCDNVMMGEKEADNESRDVKKEEKSEKDVQNEEETKVEQEKELEDKGEKKLEEEVEDGKPKVEEGGEKDKSELRKRKREDEDDLEQDKIVHLNEVVKKTKAENESCPVIESLPQEKLNETSLTTSPCSEDKESSSETINEKTDLTKASSEIVENKKEMSPKKEESLEPKEDTPNEAPIEEKSCAIIIAKEKDNEIKISESSTPLSIPEEEITENGENVKSSCEPCKDELKNESVEKDASAVEKSLEDTVETEKLNTETSIDESEERLTSVTDVPSAVERNLQTPEKDFGRKRNISETSEEQTPFKLMRISDSEEDGILCQTENESKEVKEDTEVLQKENISEESSSLQKESSCNGNVHHDDSKNIVLAANEEEVHLSPENSNEPIPAELSEDNSQPQSSEELNLENESEFVELQKIEENGSLIVNEKLDSKSSSSIGSFEKQSDDEREHLNIDAIDSEESSKESHDTRANSKGTVSETDVYELSPKVELKGKTDSEDGNDSELEKEEDEIGEEVDGSTQREAGDERKTSSHKDEELCTEKTQSSSGVSTDELSPEDPAVKEPFLSALGLGPRAKVLDGREHGYTGTLKTVIKVHRSPEKRGSKFRIMVKKRNSNAGGGSNNSPEGQDGDQGDEECSSGTERVEYRIHREANTSVDPAAADLTNFGLGNHLSTNSPFLKENAPSAENSEKSTGSKDDSKGHGTKAGENLVIPEKSSSFSIHPGRLCSDVCSYCFGKFGSLDTPCHIAQLKNVERQQKILATETHLTADSCLCDACYRHVDRKANCPSYNPSGGRKRMQRSGSSATTLCVSTGCSQPAVHQVRRKWMVKLKRVLGKKVPVDMEKTALHQPFPLCSQHYYWVEHYMQCGLCKRRLSLNHMYLLGPEVHHLNQALGNVSVPVALPEKIFVCKLCRYFCQLCLRYQDQQTLTSCNRMFCENYRKKILYQNEIEISDSEDKSENFLPPKNKRRKTKSAPSTSDGEGKSEKGDKAEKDKDSSTNNTPPIVTLDGGEGSNSTDSTDYSRAGASTPTIDYSSLAYPGTSVDVLSTPASTLSALSAKQQQKAPRIRVKVGNTTLDPATEIRPVFSPPAESAPLSDQFQMQASFDFRSPYQSGSRKRKGDWEMCNATLQFTKETKKDFINLQRPYGNYSSFIRHLVLLEKYWRSGDLMLSPGATSRASSYISSIETRIKSLEGSSRPQTSTQPAPAPYVPPALPIVTPSVSVLPLPPLVPVVPQPVALPLPPPPVAVIDLPLRRSSATTTTTSVKPLTISTIPVTVNTSSSTSTSSTSVTRIASKPPARNKPMPNIIQVTTSSGKTYPVYKAFSLQQIKALQRKQQQQQSLKPQALQIQPLPQLQASSQMQPKAQTSNILQTQTIANSADKSSTDFVPMIGDVWSLAPEKATKLWEKSEVDIISEPKSTASSSAVRQSQTNLSQPKVSVTILPKPKPAVSSKPVGRTSHLVNIAPKPVAVMTSTGILLSRNSEISVSSVSVRREDSSKC